MSTRAHLSFATSTFALIACGPGLASIDAGEEASGEAGTTLEGEAGEELDETGGETGEMLPSYETVEVPAGSFRMGCNELEDDACLGRELPAHVVELDAYAIGTYEVTVAEYRACVEAGACSIPGSCHWTTEDYEAHPINCVSWSQAVEFCSWVGGRLPTEAEWEKAARGTDFRVYPWGNDPPTCELVVSTQLCGGNGADPVGTRPVGVSPYGAHDMAGNLQEWVSDWFMLDYYMLSEAVNPQGPAEATCCKVVRGGRVGAPVEEFRTSHRAGYEVDEWNGTQIGFRCVIQ